MPILLKGHGQDEFKQQLREVVITQQPVSQFGLTKTVQGPG